MNSQNRENHQINQRKGFHPLGSDRMLVASVGSTPGSGATFVGNQGRRHRRRSLRALVARGRQAKRHTPSRFADADALDFNAFMGRLISLKPTPETYPID